MELQGDSAADRIAGNMKGVTEMKESEWSIFWKSIATQVDLHGKEQMSGRRLDKVRRSQRGVIYCWLDLRVLPE